MTWRIERTEDRFRTAGLAAHGLHDLAIRVPGRGLESAAWRLLEVLATYQLDEGRAIQAEETVQHGYWVTKLMPGPEGILEVWEMALDAQGFVPGATLTLQYWTEQRAECEGNMAEFAPPSPDQVAALSAGVLENPELLVEGVRYPAPTHASGWFLTTERYSGKVSDMRNEHLYHVTARRPEIARYLALPVGWRFEFGDGYGAVYPDEKQTSPSS